MSSTVPDADVSAEIRKLRELLFGGDYTTAVFLLASMDEESRMLVTLALLDALNAAQEAAMEHFVAAGNLLIPLVTQMRDFGVLRPDISAAADQFDTARVRMQDVFGKKAPNGS